MSTSRAAKMNWTYPDTRTKFGLNNKYKLEKHCISLWICEKFEDVLWHSPVVVWKKRLWQTDNACHNLPIFKLTRLVLFLYKLKTYATRIIWKTVNPHGISTPSGFFSHANPSFKDIALRYIALHWPQSWVQPHDSISFLSGRCLLCSKTGSRLFIETE